MLAVFFVFIVIGTSAAYADQDKVRIGFFNSDNYGYVGADGDLRGYDVHLSKAIAIYSGFESEMHGYDNVNDMENDLRSGKVDVLIDFLRTPKREKEFIFTNIPIMEEQVSLYTLNTASAPTADNIADAGTLKVGHVDDAGFLDYFMDYCRDTGVKVNLVSYPEEEDMITAMEKGETDACVSGSAVPTGYRVLVSTPPQNSYMMLRAEDTALRTRIDSALNQLKTDDPDYISNLYQRYVSSHDLEMSPLTFQERKFLTDHSNISVALVRGAEPFTIENADGSLGGIIPDYYKSLEELLGVNFSYVAYDTTQEAVDAVAGGETDILGQYYGDIIIAEKENLYDTMEYIATECVRMTRSGFTGKVKTVAATNRTAYLMAEQMGADITVEPYPDVEACYQALMRNEVDALVGTMTATTWLVNQHTMRGVNLSIMPNITIAMRGAVARDNSSLLFILNKAIVVSQNSMNEAILKNAVNGKTNLRTTLENLPVGVTAGIVAVLALLVFLLITSLVLLARNSKERVELLNREMNMDGLTGAGSRRYGTDMLGHELLMYKRYGEGPMIAMLDVDHFKGKNDKYGHEYGDFVLRKVVEVMRSSLRKSDTIIRWGGDEFILVFPKIHDRGAEHTLDRLIRTVNSSDFLMDGTGEQITISVGAAFFKEDDEDIAPVLRRCDSALYKAKNVRNTYCIYSSEPGYGENI